MADKKRCKVCCQEVGDQYSEVLEDREIVIVDEQIPIAYILNSGDCLCNRCGEEVTYYRRIRYDTN